MAKRKDEGQRRDRVLPDPDDFYFDDELDSVIGSLPTEEDHLPVEEAPPAPKPLTTGVGRAGVRMFGLPGTVVDRSAPAAEEPADPEDAWDYGEDAVEESADPFEADDDLYQYEPVYDEDADAPQEESAQEQPVRARKMKQQRVLPEKEPSRVKHPKLRAFLLTTVTVLLLGIIGVMALARTMYPDASWANIPDRAVAGAVGPAQSLFSGFVEHFADYFRNIKIRSNIEQEYVKLAQKNEELAIIAAFADEYARRLAQYEDIDQEIRNNLDLNPLRCQVIGAEQGSYFSTITIDAGSRQGIEEYMAVTIGGALVGYTENVYDTTSTVRTIIDSDASIAALIQSSRDQGTVRGTLGVDGTAMCRMYYLPADHLPRPGDIVVTSGVGMSFPKGIPIGTVRESTRNMEANKQYIVVEPEVDFRHLEYVIVLRYKPAAEAVQGRASTATYNEFVPTVSARPYPTLRIGTTQRFGETATPVPTMSVTPTPTPSPTPRPTPTLTPVPTISGPVFEYNSDLLGPSPTPTASPTPSPTPVVTLDPSDFTWEEEE